AVWFAYNAVTFGDWLDFARGPYSAKAIELRTAHGAVKSGAPLHPGWHNPWVALLFYVKVVEMDALAVWPCAAGAERAGDGGRVAWSAFRYVVRYAATRICVG